MDLGSTIGVTAIIQNPSVNRLNFGEPAIFANVAATIIPAGQRTRRYSSATGLVDMVADGFLTSDPAYLAAAALCSQSPRPQTFKILCSRLAYTYGATLTCNAANAPDTLDVTIRAKLPGGTGAITEAVVSVLGTGNAANNATALHAALQATAFDPLGVVFALAAPAVNITTNPATNNVVYYDDLHNVTVDDTTVNRGIAADMTAILAADSDWYELIPADSFGGAELVELATSISGATNKMMRYTSQDSETLTGVGIFDVLTAANRTRAIGAYLAGAMDYYPAAAASAYALSRKPGTYQEAFMSLTGVPPSTLTTAELALLHADYANTYTGVSIGGVSIVAGDYQRGWCHGSTETYADTIRLIDATVAEIQIRIFSALRAADKIPYTDAGLAVIKGCILEAIKSFQPLGFEPGTEVANVPRAADISAIDRAARRVPDVTCGARIAGAVNRVSITLTLAY